VTYRIAGIDAHKRMLAVVIADVAAQVPSPVQNVPGNTKLNVVPRPTSLSTKISPPCASTICLYCEFPPRTTFTNDVQLLANTNVLLSNHLD
jgi:hypothetical protein